MDKTSASENKLAGWQIKSSAHTWASPQSERIVDAQTPAGSLTSSVGQSERRQTPGDKERHKKPDFNFTVLF